MITHFLRWITSLMPWITRFMQIRVIHRKYVLSNVNKCNPTRNPVIQREFILSKMKIENVLYNATIVLSSVITCYTMQQRVIQCMNVWSNARIAYVSFCSLLSLFVPFRPFCPVNRPVLTNIMIIWLMNCDRSFLVIRRKIWPDCASSFPLLCPNYASSMPGLSVDRL